MRSSVILDEDFESSGPCSIVTAMWGCGSAARRSRPGLSCGTRSAVQALGLVVAAVAAPTMPASLRNAAATTGVRVSSSGIHL